MSKEIKEKIIEILEGKTIDILKEADKRGGLDNKEYQKIQTDQILSLFEEEKQKAYKEVLDWVEYHKKWREYPDKSQEPIIDFIDLISYLNFLCPKK